jgi:mannose-6-phosphate isomerase-like protein (cupin superfamily)
VKDISSGARETLPVELAGKINSDSVPYWKFFKSIEIVENRSCRVKGCNESGSLSTAARYSDLPYTLLHRHRCEDVYYVVEGSGELESDGRLHPLSPGCAVLDRSRVKHHVFNRGPGILRLVVVAGIMLVPLLLRRPYRLLDGRRRPIG